jgi:hypothetical protein
MFAPLRLLLSALSLGRLSGDPVHDEVRPDSKALQSRVRFASKGPSSCSQSPKTGRSGRSSSFLVGRLSLTLLSRLWAARRRSLPRVSRFYVSSFKRPPLPEPSIVGRCVKARRPRRLSKACVRAPRACGPRPPRPVFWHSCHHVQQSSRRDA